MKAFIWLFCFFVAAVIQTAVREVGILLGAVPSMLLYALTWWSAKKLCAAWDRRKTSKSTSDYADSLILPPETFEVDANVEATLAVSTSSNLDTPKHRFCKQCGNPIDPDTRKCADCNKQGFRPLVLRKKHLLVGASILLCTAAMLLIFFLISQLNDAEAKVEELRAQITELNSELAEQEEIASRYINSQSSIQSSYEGLQKKYEELLKENEEVQKNLGRYESLVAIVSGNGSKTYHKLPCPYLETGWGIYVYSIPFVENEGYTPCFHCYG